MALAALSSPGVLALGVWGAEGVAIAASRLAAFFFFFRERRSLCAEKSMLLVARLGTNRSPAAGVALILFDGVLVMKLSAAALAVAVAGVLIRRLALVGVAVAEEENIGDLRLSIVVLGVIEVILSHFEKRTEISLNNACGNYVSLKENVLPQAFYISCQNALLWTLQCDWLKLTKIYACAEVKAAVHTRACVN